MFAEARLEGLSHDGCPGCIIISTLECRHRLRAVVVVMLDGVDLRHITLLLDALRCCTKAMACWRASFLCP